MVLTEVLSRGLLQTPTCFRCPACAELTCPLRTTKGAGRWEDMKDQIGSFLQANTYRDMLEVGRWKVEDVDTALRAQADKIAAEMSGSSQPSSPGPCIPKDTLALPCSGLPLSRQSFDWY
ncbi:unnamed protein product [Symbiodinium natans]|uniref:Uncharacterized protein n=1 Tax=Symbiodinium natans TaxID=878477 RepID=A0A812TME1_9DINO|nr:unnamed protein product [Symbiodinium natans]